MRHKTGDLITLAEQGEFDVIVHGCNCFCTMGSGIAKQIRERYPAAYEADCTTQKGDMSKLGGYTWVRVLSPQRHPFIIVNGYTQFRYGRDRRHADYNAIASVFSLIKHNFPHSIVGYPLIGAGRAGGDWSTIERIINAQLAGINHYLVTLEDRPWECLKRL